MRRWHILGCALALAIAGLPTRVEAQAAPSQQCELHVWPTAVWSAVYHTVNVGMFNGAAVISGRNLTPMEHVAQRLAVAIPVADQVERIEQLDLGGSGMFAGYRVIMHEAPVQSSFANWVAEDVGAGPRQTDSTAPCYAELHVIFITLFRTWASKKIQTAFVFREFGPTGDAVFTRADAGSTGAPQFDTEGEVDDEAARESVREAFAENVRIMLRSRTMRNRRRP